MKRSLRLAALIAAACISACATADPSEDFFVAIVRDNPDTVRSLIAAGFDPNTRDRDGQPGLYLAMRRDSMRVAAALIESKKTDVNALSKAGESPLMMAALRGDVGLSKTLIARGAAVNKTGWAPLHYAATGKNPEEIKLLIDKGATIDPLSPNGSTPLMMAAGYGAEANVDLLLFWGADIRRVNDLKLNAADFAKQGGREALEARLRTAIAAAK